MQKFDEKFVDISQLLLDPNNYRFQDAADFVFADSKRFAEDTVQNKAFERLRSEALVPLKNSILRNGFLPFERLVVAPYGDHKYLVLEGNRRLAALRWIERDMAAGAAVDDAVKEALKGIPVVIVSESESDPAIREALMGIRHVSGIREWGGYQRAQLIAVLKDKHHLETTDIAQRLGMTANEVNRRYRAYKALKQLMEDEDYGDHAQPDMYPIFHEAVSLPVVRDWLSWGDDTCEFKNHDELVRFYELITPHTNNEDGTTREPKIDSYSKVRDLRAVLENSEAKKVLFDPNRSFVDAVAITKRDELANSWKAELIEAIVALESIGALELKRLGGEDLKLLTRVRDAAAELLQDAEKLKGP